MITKDVFATCRATCGMELDHVTIGYPKLSDFVRSLHDICRMKIVPVGRGPATHMVLLPPGNGASYIVVSFFHSLYQNQRKNEFLDIS